MALKTDDRDAGARNWALGLLRLLALYALVTAFVAYTTDNVGMAPFLLLYVAAFGTMAGVGLAQMIAPHPDRPPSHAPGQEVNRRGLRDKQ